MSVIAERENRRPRAGSGRTLVRVLLACVILMTFRIFQFFPGMQYVQEAWFVLCFLALVFVYPIVKIVIGSGVSTFEVYLLALMPLNVLIPAWGAAREFGQPMTYGILAQRGAALIAAVLLIFIAMRLKILRVQDIEATLLLLAWGTGGLYLLINLFLDPANFTSYGEAFVSTDADTAKFVLRAELLSFGLIYYALLALRKRRTKYYVLAAVFLIVIGSISDARAFVVSFALVFLYFAYRWRPIGPFLATIGKTCAAAAVMLGMFYVVRPAYVSDRVAAFADAFRVVSLHSEVEDASAQVRVFEVITAWPYVLKNPLLGTGTISNQWNGGTRALVDFNFVPADIGLVGVIYSFGVIGMLIFAYQFRFALKAARRLPDRMRSPLFDACLGYVMLNAILSFSAPGFVFYPEITLFFVAVLVFLSYERRLESRSVLELPRSIHSVSS